MAQINKPSEYFNTKLYTGNGSTNAVTGVGFAPDFVWIKERSSTSSNVLGTTIQGANKRLQSDTTSAEGTLTNLLTSFDSDGFTNGADNGVNESGQTYASWNWLGGGTGVSNTDGSITSTVSANTTSGFSIVAYTGTGSAATIGHGLGVAPACIIFKTRNTTSDWFVYHQSTGATNRTKLNQTVASSASTFINDTTPSSTVFNTEGGGATGTNGNTYIAYCFAEKKGYSKFGSYTGNGNTDGTFIYTGFKPAFIITKRTSSTSAWLMYDNKRNTFNLTDKKLFANESGSENLSTDPAGVTASSNNIDILSNGFKQRTSDSYNNGSGQTYIYMAFAEEPLVGTNNITATAR